MRVLVIDDKKANQISAEEYLKDHDLTVVGSYKDAEEILEVKYDEEKVEKILAQNGIINQCPHGWDPKYQQAKREVEQESIIPFTFDAVLVDHLLPASGKQQGPGGRRFVGQEMPIGIFLALLAAKRGAKYAAVFTDTDHHSHPASACFDAFNKGENNPTPFIVEGAKVILSNTRSWIDFDYKYDDKSVSDRKKNWKKLLDYLISA